MRQIDEVHDAEDQRQPGRDQKQQHAELQPVQCLDEKEKGRQIGLKRIRPLAERRGAE
jgi:hypothetical protein